MAKNFVGMCAVVACAGNLACATAPAVRPAETLPVPPRGELVEPAKERVAAAPPALFKDPVTGMELIRVKGGCYRMGSSSEFVGPEERPAHEVCLDDFYIGKYEVTQGQWKAIMRSNPSAQAGFGDQYPVENVSWNDVHEFVGALNQRSAGDGGPPGVYRLPTEAEWEYAARSGGKEETFAGRSDDPNSVSWSFLNSFEMAPLPAGTRPVGLKAPNGLGLYDMTGNVWEWTNDAYGATYYSSSPRDNPPGPATGEFRVARGGSFIDMHFDMRTSYRNYLPPDYRSGSKGFRLVRAAPVRAADH